MGLKRAITKGLARRDLEKEFPGSVNWGILGSMGGSWRSPSAWKCPKCGGDDRLVVWGKGREVLSCQCFACWSSGKDQVEQLTLF
jgi:hypothetical protein